MGGTIVREMFHGDDKSIIWVHRPVIASAASLTSWVPHVNIEAMFLSCNVEVVRLPSGKNR